MNKTLDINIANQIFHIDEQAYKILKKYLDDIKTYLSSEESRDEIIQDIEARIAELFIERMISDKQVINDTDVNEVIKVMGQPEDYNLSDESDDSSKKTGRADKKLYRDRETAYISGVSAGIAHYLNVEVIWIRLIWVLFTIFSTGWLILAYIILWILVPEAKTTAEKLSMKGEQINLSNIEKKIKEGYENVSDKLKGVDVEKHSKKAQSSISGFFKQLEKFLIVSGKVILKVIGFFLLIVSGIGLISLIFGALGIGGVGLFAAADFNKFVRIDPFMSRSLVPTWLIITSVFTTAVIPLLFIFIFSLKMLFHNIKRPNLAFVITLVSIWLLSIATLIFSAVNAENRNRIRGEFVETNTIDIEKQDTLFVKMKGNLNYTNTPYRHNSSKIVFDDNNKKIIYDSDVDIKFHSITEEQAYIRVSKFTYDYEEDEARKWSKSISYKYEINKNNITLDAYMLAPLDLEYNSRGVDVDIYLPEEISILMNKNVEYFLKNRFENYEIDAAFDKIFNISDGQLKCKNCTINTEEAKSTGEIEKKEENKILKISDNQN
jgi:phage shock protein PspC (stress-responsive transcriptional regulator)